MMNSKLQCPVEDCEYEIYSIRVRDLKSGLKNHIREAHSSRQIELYKKVDRLVEEGRSNSTRKWMGWLRAKKIMKASANVSLEVKIEEYKHLTREQQKNIAKNLLKSKISNDIKIKNIKVKDYY